MDIHISPVEFVATWCYVIIGGFMWRSFAATQADKPLGQAMAYIY